jgi:hypothetical protein
MRVDRAMQYLVFSVNGKHFARTCATLVDSQTFVWRLHFLIQIIVLTMCLQINWRLFT